jgi:hypothetical protein
MYACMHVFICVRMPYSHFHNDCLFFLEKKTQVAIPEPTRTGSVFVLSVRYQYSFFFMLKKRIIMKMKVPVQTEQLCAKVTLILRLEG